MPKIIGRALAALCAFMLFASPALAQVPQLRDADGHPYQVLLGFDSVTGLTCVIGASPTCNLAGAGGGGGGGGTADLSPFLIGGNAPLSATTSSARVAVPTAEATLIVQNLGPVAAVVKLGNSSVTAATSDFPIQPGQVVVLARGASTHLAAITASGTASLVVTSGTGTPFFGLALDNASATPTKGSIAVGAAATDPPQVEGCRGSNTNPTAVGDGQVVSRRCSLLGDGVMVLGAPPEMLVQGLTAAMTGTTSTAVTGMGAPGSGLRNYITNITCGNSHATVGTFVELQDGSGGTTFWTIPAAANYGGAVIPLAVPIRQPTANTALFVKDTTTGANVVCSAAGFKAP